MATTAGTEGPEWSARAAGWAEQWGAFAAPAREALAEAAGIGPGTRVLDIGCGSGELCALAAGRGAEVAGIDAAEGMIEIARRRVPGADLRVGPMEQLPWEDGAFDVATAVNALQFAADYVERFEGGGARGEPGRCRRDLQLGTAGAPRPVRGHGRAARRAVGRRARDRRSRRARAACPRRRASSRARRATSTCRSRRRTWPPLERAFLVDARRRRARAARRGRGPPPGGGGGRAVPPRRRLVPVREPLPLSGGRGQPANAASSFGATCFLRLITPGRSIAPSVRRLAERALDRGPVPGHVERRCPCP